MDQTEKIEYADNMAKEWAEIFRPNFEKLKGTKKLRRFIKEYVETHKFERPQDLKLSLTCYWIDHIQAYREKHGKTFEPDDVFRVKIPDFIKNILCYPI